MKDDNSQSRSDQSPKTATPQSSADSLSPLPENLTYSALIDDDDREIAISDFMVQRACEEMDETMEWPFSSLEDDDDSLAEVVADVVPLRRK